MTLDHRTSDKWKFFEIEIYTEKNKLSIDVWFVRIGQYLKIWNLRVQKKYIYILRNSPLNCQMKSLAMHITNQKLSFDIFTVENVQSIFIEHDLYLIS